MNTFRGWISTLALASAAIAQERTSAIGGAAVDAQGRPVEGARIVAGERGTGNTREARTGADGTYLLPRLDPGVYVVSAEKDGFKTSKHEQVLVELDRRAVVNHRLEVGEIRESIAVKGEALQIEASPSALSSIVDTATIQQLPLNGRDFLQLVSLQAGAPVARAQDRTVNTGYGVQVSISGSRPFQNGVRLDGLYMTTSHGSMPGSVLGMNFGVDSIAEFSVHTSSSGAQHGQSAGGVVNAVTRSGTNDLHGSAYYFHRNDNLDARNFFDGAEVPEFRRHQFGASVGGPIQKGKTFYFANVEQLRQQRGSTTVNTTLSEAARTGNLVSGRVTVDPTMAKVVALYPLPNGQVFGDTGIYSFANPATSDQDFVTGRLDHHLTAKDRFFGRYTFEGGSRNSETDFRAAARRSATRQQSAVIEHMHVFTPSILNSARIGFLRTKNVDGESASLLPAADSPDLTYINTTPGMGLITISSGVTDFPGGTGSVSKVLHALTSYQLSNDLDILRGRHSFKIGGRFERTHFNTDSQTRQSGEFRFTTISTFLRNIPDRFRGTLAGSDTLRGHRQSIGGLYAQDTWRAAKRVTVEFGVRWEPASVPYEVNGKAANLVNLTDRTMTLGNPIFRNPAMSNFAPRGGIAWDALGNSKLMVRAGYGMFFDLILSPYISFSGVRNPPFLERAETRLLVQGDFPKRGFEALLRSPTLDLGVERLPPNPKQPYAQQWNFSIEYSMNAATSLRSAYVGSHGLNLSSIVSDANIPDPTTMADGRLFWAPNGPFKTPAFGQIRDRTFSAASFYQGLQNTFRHRMRRGVQLQATYTFSKSIDDSSNFYASSEAPNRGLLPLNGSPRFNRGLSGHDVRHYGTISGTWELPLRDGPGVRRVIGGWQASSIVILGSGLPTTVWLGYDAARTRTRQTGSNSGQRPDLAPGVTATPVTGNPLRWVDTSAFRMPAAGFLGNLGRNTIAGPGLANTDFSAVKRARVPFLGEAGTVELRVEFFNFLNHTNFNLPAVERMEIFGNGNGVTREDFGRITSAADSREIQFGLKFRF